ncbi:phytochrome-like protein cph1 [mine drainage metagenome]|uniref:histidine kinase n=1 Tax=mine drainage metagenome TaxID=410659 RepID=A0A1J5RSU8_9ZZZZ
MNKPRFGLIARIATLVLLIEIIACGLLGFFYVQRFSQAEMDRLHAQLRLFAQLVAQENLPISAVSDGAMLRAFIGVPCEQAMIIGQGGWVIAALDPALLGQSAASLPGDDPAWAAGSGGERFRAWDDHLSYTALLRAANGAPLYILRLTVNSAEINHQRLAIILRGLALAGLVVVLGSLAILLMTRAMITRRLDRSLDVLLRIENGDLSSRIEVPVADELGRLQDGINSMTATIGALVGQHRRNEEEITAILDAIADGVLAVGLDGRILRCNPSAARLLGANADALAAQDFAACLPALAARLPAAWQQAGSAGEAEILVELPRPPGEPREAEASHAPILDQSGAVLGGVLVLHDITERSKTERRLQDAVERLTVSNTELERFAYVASHDLQEPLRTIVSFTQLLERRWGESLPGEAREYSGFVIDAAKHMRLLITDLLTYSRVNSKSSRQEVLPLEDCCEAALRNLHESLQESGGAVTLADLPWVRGDKIQLIQLFQNLIGNALKFRRPGVAPRVTVSARRLDDAWQVDVADNGIGIDAGGQDVFEIFNRLQARQVYPGSGVGLAICKRIVQKHGGAIWYDSQPGQGTIFHVTLPLSGARE